ncbi:Response regulator protein VraR [Planctomycetes bacterium Pan216]|uniref:Response regulator protein VraR n=1 Tax=Kolteria novifilia TaxID=2527975 RepID=A0A518BA55_9BACT|nr:Response regulator protein VraR [Planctomycetes bacterium Pan216]
MSDSNSSEASISILLASSETFVRESVQSLLEKESDLTVSGTAEDGTEAVAAAKRLRPEVILLSDEMPGLNPFEAAERIRKTLPRTRLCFLSRIPRDHAIDCALAVEAACYFTTADTPESLVNAIRKVAQGETYFSPDVEERIVNPKRANAIHGVKQSRMATLTAREVQVLRYLAEGLPRKEISKVLGISAKTVARHTANLMTKLEIHDRVVLARFAIREGLVDV